MLYNIIQFRRLLDCVNTLSVDKLISLYGSHHINISTYQHINKTHSSIQSIFHFQFSIMAVNFTAVKFRYKSATFFSHERKNLKKHQYRF